MNDRPVFYYDFSSPYAWLAAERVDSVLPVPPVWQPVSFGHILQASGREPWSFHEPSKSDGIAEIERRAAERGLPAPRWIEGWPLATYSLLPLRAAIFAQQAGRAASFSLAAFRQFFAAGRTLADLDNVLIAAAASELHPRAVTRGVESKTVKDALRQATEEAIRLGVVGVPTVAIGSELFWGDDKLEEAAAALA
ncbi:MAG TPA: DsbA family protein [Thermoleophilaceae bacterium]|nr:DsbA family protein [Thermoleophilaceae bacterium]